MFLIQQRNRVPQSAVVHQQVEQQFANPGRTLKKVSSSADASAPNQAVVSYEAVFELKDADYVRLDTLGFLSGQLGLDPSVIQGIKQLVGSKDGATLVEKAGLSKAPILLSEVVIIKEAAAPGTLVTFSGQLQAFKQGERWTFNQLGVPNITPQLGGHSRASFPSTAFVATNTDDLARLKGLVQDETDALERLRKADEDLIAQRLRENAKVTADLAHPGSLFAGTAVSNQGESTKLYLEIASYDSASGQVRAYLRNDGGWSERRVFTGNFAYVPETGVVTLRLSSPYESAIPNAGPFLQNGENMVFSLSGDKEQVTGISPNGAWQYNLQHLSPEAAKAQQQEVQDSAAAILAATLPQTVYLGVITSADHANSNAYVLTFDRQDNGGAILSAHIEATDRNEPRRAFHGSIVTNRYVSGGWPIIGKVTAQQSVYPLKLKFEDGHLVGNAVVTVFDKFSWDFTPASADDIRKLRAEAEQRRQLVMNIVKPGAAYDGYFTSDDSHFVERARMKFTRVEQGGALVEAVLVSLDSLKTGCRLRGTLDMNSARLTLSRTKAVVEKEGYFHSPPFRESYGDHVFDLDITPNGLEGKVRNEPWAIRFSSNGLAPSPQDQPEASAPGPQVQPGPPAHTSDYPAGEGIYLWLNGAWAPLPHNNGHVTYPVAQVLGNVGGLLNALTGNTQGGNIQTRPDKLAELTFDGVDPIPSTDGNGVRVVYIGKIDPPPPDVVAKFPEILDYPPIEMAMTLRDASGSRSASLYRIVPGLSGFRDTRVPATVERVSDTVTVLTCNQPLAPGSYVVAAGVKSAELIAK